MISENQYKVCILTAGKGSRLAPITDHLNKACYLWAKRLQFHISLISFV